MAIDWAKRINEKDDSVIDLQGLPYYSIKFDEQSKIQRVYEYDVVLPTEPKDEDCINFGLSEHDQIFRKTFIPKQVLNPNGNYGRDSWRKEEIDAFVDAEWNRRRHGVWIFIKGHKTYIPGLLYMKMNYWKSITGNKFIYKFSDLEFFLFWMHCVYDPKCDGMADFKCRQIGDTENVVLIIWEYGSRVRGSINAMQSCINEGHAKKSYYRLVHGHKKMLYYFRPINQGTEDPKKGLNLSYPAQHITFTSIKEKNKAGEIANKSSLEDYEFPEIGSQFYYGPSRASEFDGTTLGRAYCDEFGKSDGKLDPTEWIQVIREAIESRILNKKMGMIMMTSTVEDIGADSLAWAKKIYNQSDPNKRTPSGKTANGLYRCFRNVVDRGEVDRWGYPLKEKIISEINSTVKMLMESGDVKGAISYRRKNCITIDDVFKGANDNSQFDIEKLESRYHYIHNEAPKQLWVRGNLKWKDNIRDTEVIWEPNSKGRWLISGHPHDLGLEANKKVTGVFNPKPGNTNHYISAVDPYDQKDTMESEDNRSKGGIAVKSRLNEFIDGKTENYYQFDDNSRGIRIGDPMNWGANFVTNRYVCSYLERPDPSDFFEDVLMTMVYYGTEFLPEKNKSGALQSYLETRGYSLYILEKPNTTKNYKGKTETGGITASVGVIDTYFSHLQTLSAKWSGTIDLPNILEQLLSMNWDNRGKKDLGVSVGLCELADKLPKTKFTQRKQQEVHHWTENIV